MKKKAFICNGLIILLELIGFILYGVRMHTLSLEYYTMDSNLFALITSIMFVVFFKSRKELVRDLRFIATCCLTVTFLVVIFILLPMTNFNIQLLFLQNETMIFHVIAPIISIISYICFEEKSDKEYLGFLFTAFYAFVLIILNLKDIVVGPYPFLMVKKQSIIATLLWGVIILGGSYGIGQILNTLNQKIKGAKK